MSTPIVVRVHFVDMSAKSFAVKPNDTVEVFEKAVIARMEVKESSCFALFEKRGKWERPLEPEEKVSSIVKSWKDADSKKEPKIFFKKKIYMIDDEKEMNDPVAKHLVFIQAVASVIDDVYPCTPEDAIKLAGLLMQHTYGDHSKEMHSSGFLSSTDKLKNFIPKSMLATRKASEWENAIYKSHSSRAGMEKDEALAKYLDMVKHFPYYGTTFFPSCKSVGNGKKIPSRVCIGVNAAGILLVKPKVKELITSHPHTDICSWSYSSSTFGYEFGTSQYESTKYTFETRGGSIIASCIQTYIDVLVKMLTAGEGEEGGGGEVDGSED